MRGENKIESLTNYTRLGPSGLRVSPLCLGTMTFGEDGGWGNNAADSRAIFDRFLDANGNVIDIPTDIREATPKRCWATSWPMRATATG